MALYRIADLTVQMDVSGRTERQAIPYLARQDSVADMVLTFDAAQFLEKYPQMKDLDTAQYIGTVARSPAPSALQSGTALKIKQRARGKRKMRARRVKPQIFPSL